MSAARSPAIAPERLPAAAPALLFPGQGAKRADAALRAVMRTERGLALCEIAAREADVPIRRLIERPALLDRTEVLQPVLTAISLAVAEALLAAGVAPAIVAGHSLGELAAWSLAGGPTAEECVRLAALRGRLMAREAAANPGGMVALATADPASIEAALAAGGRAGALCLAARNAPDETVLSGDEAAVRAVLAASSGLATRVPTAGAWHSPAMAGAVEAWRSALEPWKSALEPWKGALEPSQNTVSARSAATGTQPFRRPVLIANRHGEAVSDAADIPSLLAEQLVRPVEWARSMATVAASATAIVTIGPGAVLRALWRRNRPTGHDAARSPAARSPAAPDPVPLLDTDDERSLAAAIATLRAAP